MVDLDLNLGLILFILWPHFWLLGWVRFGKVTHLMAFEAHEMRYFLLFLLFHFLALALVEANATLVTIASFVVQHVLKGDFGVVASL